MQDFERRLVDAVQTQASAEDIILQNRLRAGQKVIQTQNYSYTASLENIAPSTGYVQLPILTNGDSDFIMTYMSAAAYNHADNSQLNAPYVKLQVTDNSSQRTMFSDPALMGLITGSAGFPYILQSPKLVPANTQIITQIYNLLTVDNISIDFQIAFGGIRVYYA